MENEAVTAPAEPQVVPEAQAEETPEPQSTPSRQDALQNAFKKMEEAEKPDEAEKPAEPAPEPPAKEAPKDEKAEAKTPDRDENGRFKAKSPDEAPKQPEKPDETPTLGDAPSRFSADAKADWAKAPESVRGEAIRAVREMEAGLKQKDDQLAPLKPYLDMAAQHGVRLEQALQSYTSLEGLLRHNPTAGLQKIAQNMGLTPQSAAALMLGQQPQDQDPRDQKIMHLERQMAGMQQNVQGQRQDMAMQQVRQFAAQNEHFEALSQDVAQILQQNPQATLEDAYAQALARAQNLAQRFAPPPPQPEAPATPAQTRLSKSVTGAPTAGSNPGTRKPSATRQEALSRAAAQLGL